MVESRPILPNGRWWHFAPFPSRIGSFTPVTDGNASEFHCRDARGVQASAASADELIKTANALGIAVPASVLTRADELIE